MKTLNVESLQLLKHLFETHNLADAAARIGMPTSSASRLLSKLRELFDDELFTRCTGGLAPTQRMVSLIGDVNDLLLRFETLLAPERFAPAALERTFRIGCADRATRFITPMLEALAQTAPGVSIEIVRLENQWERSLRDGTLDLVISPTDIIGEGFSQIGFGDGMLRVIVAPGHPLIDRYEAKGALTMEDLLDFGHVEVVYEPADFYRDNKRAESELWRRRRIVATTPYFMSAIMMVRFSKLVLLLTVSKEEYFDTLGAVRTLPAPAELTRAHFVPKLIWHERSEGDVALEWFRSFLWSHATRQKDR